MIDSIQSLTLAIIFFTLTLIVILNYSRQNRFQFGYYLTYTWIFFLSFVSVRYFSLNVGVWILAILSFIALREYLSLIDIRLQDRLGILGAYLSIPFMYHFVKTEWYGMFIISIPVYSFLAIPLLVTLGGRKSKGTVFSIGAIDFGLFLFVFCLGHVGYLLHFGFWKPILLVLNILICDIVILILKGKSEKTWRNCIYLCLIPLPFTVALSCVMSSWSGISTFHSCALGTMIPLLVLMGHHLGEYIKEDLGVSDDALFPGRGQILDNLKSFFFAAPVAFHYIRYFLT